MLVLSRKEEQSIVIAHDIIVTVLQCTGHVVRLGITAPRHVQIDREEVFEQRMQNGSQFPMNLRHDKAAAGGQST